MKTLDYNVPYSSPIIMDGSGN